MRPDVQNGSDDTGALPYAQGRDAATNFPHEHYSERWAELTGGMALDALAAELRSENRARRSDAEPRGRGGRTLKHAPSRYTCAPLVASCSSLYPSFVSTMRYPAVSFGPL